MGRLLKVLGLAAGSLVPALVFFAVPAPAAAPDAGEAVFKAQCASCHSVTARGGSAAGPRLSGVVGRRAGTQPGFAYSPAMKGSGVTWTPDQLKRFLASPAQSMRGNRMPYAGLRDPKKLDALVDWLGKQK